MKKSGFWRPRFLLIVLSLCCAACATKMRADGQQETSFDPRYLAKTEIDRVIDVTNLDVLSSLHRVADKLYRRNPKQWRIGGFPKREAALEYLFSEHAVFASLEGRREGGAVLFALSLQFEGDRVQGVMAGLLGMINAAFENKNDFYILDDLDAQKLYNCARNLEIAVWKISSAKGEDGLPFILSNELDSANPNLSFEREFGKMIALLDLLSKIVADKQGRSVSRITQNLATAIFLPVGALGIR